MCGRPLVRGLLCLVVFGMGCGPDPTVLPSARWGVEFAAAECARIFGCCDAVEQMELGLADQAQCRQDVAAQEQRSLDAVLSIGKATYDAKAARRCVDEIMTLPCGDLTPFGKDLIGPACARISRGAAKIGASCEDLDVICESANCLPVSGTCGPTRGCDVVCGANESCDQTARACVPLATAGAACAYPGACAFPLTCQPPGVCAVPLPGGAACGTAADCASDSCTGGACDAMKCDGV